MPHQHIKPDFRRFHVILEELGVDVAPLYKALGIGPVEYSGHGRGISIGKYHALLEMAAEQTGDPALGLAIGRHRARDDLGVIGLMVRNAPTFERAVDIVCRYLNLVSPGADTALERDGDTCIWRYDYTGFEPEKCRHSVDATMLQFADLIRKTVRNESWMPEAVYFRHARPSNLSPLERALGHQLIFDHHLSGIAFSKTILPFPISNADPSILAILEDQVQASLHEFDERRDLRGRISFLIATGIGKADISLERIARDVGMSRRTLHRYLLQSGTSFHQLRDNVIETYAKKLLSTTSVSVTEIALTLGFADASAFNNSFKRLAGTTPLKYRREHV